MAKSKSDSSLVSSKDNRLQHLHLDITGVIGNQLSIKDHLNLMLTSKSIGKLFQPNFLTHLGKNARICALFGDKADLSLIAQHRPEALFNKGQATDNGGRIFYNVSAYQLILFLCDKNLKDAINPLIPQTLSKIREVQEKEMGVGGCDLIKLDNDPNLIAGEDFTGITEFEITFDLFDQTQHSVIFPLLENPDGIVYYQDKKQGVHFYYVNRQENKIVELNARLESNEDKEAFNEFKKSFEEMENNSGRRSSNNEHELIAKILNCSLQREGIRYEDNGIGYQDSCNSFNELTNAYRECMRLGADGVDASASWDKIGKIQKKVIWLAQCYCAKNLPFYPAPYQLNDFERKTYFFNQILMDFESFLDEKTQLGSGFAFYKGFSWYDMVAYDVPPPEYCASDLIAVIRIIDDAKANIMQMNEDNDSICQP